MRRRGDLGGPLPPQRQTRARSTTHLLLQYGNNALLPLSEPSGHVCLLLVLVGLCNKFVLWHGKGRRKGLRPAGGLLTDSYATRRTSRQIPLTMYCCTSSSYVGVADVDVCGEPPKKPSSGGYRGRGRGSFVRQKGKAKVAVTWKSNHSVLTIWGRHATKIVRGLEKENENHKHQR